MANICENNLKVYSEDIRNVEYIKEFFGKDADIENEEEDILELCFSSEGDFPIKRMNYMKVCRIKIILIWSAYL